MKAYLCSAAVLIFSATKVIAQTFSEDPSYGSGGTMPSNETPLLWLALSVIMVGFGGFLYKKYSSIFQALAGLAILGCISIIVTGVLGLGESNVIWVFLILLACMYGWDFLKNSRKNNG